MSEVNSHGNRGQVSGSYSPVRGGSSASAAIPNTPVQQAYPQPSNYQVPIAVPTHMAGGSPNYGGSPSNFNGGGKHTSKLLIVGIIILVLALISLAVAMLFVFKPFGLFEEEVNAEAPNVGQVEEMFKSSDFEKNMLSGFQFVNTENMQDPKLKSTKVGEVKRNDANKEIYCEASTDAEVANDSISASTTLSMRLTYDKDSSSWKDGGVQTGNISATPEGPADIAAIQESIPSLLRSYDSSVAAQFSGSEITSDSQLTKDGGTASFVLTKAAEGEGEAKTCTVNTEVKWNDSRGWQVTITSVDGIEEQPEEPPEEQPAPEEPAQNNEPAQQPSSGGSSGGNGGNGGNSGSQPTMLLVCYSGDLVQVPGVIEFEGSHILLRTDHVIRVEFDNRVFITTYFELTGNGGWYRGEHTTVIGEISATGSLGKAPLVINVDYV